MGTSIQNASSEENFIKIDREYVELFFLFPSWYSLISYGLFRYVVNAAKVAKTDKDQRLIYVSVRSSFFESVC
jgi:hypothetical protein